MTRVVRRALHCYGARWAVQLRLDAARVLPVTAPENDNWWRDAGKLGEMRRWFGGGS